MALGGEHLRRESRPTGRPATALGARASRLQSRRRHRLCPCRLHEKYFGDEYCYPTLCDDPTESEMSEMRERDASEMRERDARFEAPSQLTAVGAVRAIGQQMMNAPSFMGM